MDGLPLHPAVVHFPVVLGFLSPFITCLITWGLLKEKFSRKSWIIVAVLHAVLVVSGVVSMRTGEQEEQKVVMLTGGESIHEHEEKAEGLVYIAAGVLALSVVALLPLGLNIVKYARLGAALGSLALVVFSYLAGHSGGELVYKRGAAGAYSENKESKH